MCVCACTSLSSEASRCSDLSDMRKLRVVSTIGCGPGFSGAYWTFLITRRTEFLNTQTHFRFRHCTGSTHPSIELVSAELTSCESSLLSTWRRMLWSRSPRRRPAGRSTACLLFKYLPKYCIWSEAVLEEEAELGTGGGTVVGRTWVDLYY